MTFWEKIKFISSKAFEFLLPFIKILLSQAGMILAESAMKAVTTMSLTDLSNDAKRVAAFDSIMSDLKAKGITLGTSVINSAIETAVLNLKEKMKV